VFTDISEYILSASVTNSVESIYEALLFEGLIPENIEIFEHREDSGYESFQRVTIPQATQTEWIRYDRANFCKKYEINAKEFFVKTEKDARLMPQISMLAHKQNPFRHFPNPPDPHKEKRRLVIEDKMITKSKLLCMIEKNATEQELLKVLKTDLSIFAEQYVQYEDEYICFSEFPIGNAGNADFVLFSGRSWMCVTLIEVKGADFQLMANRSGYNTFSAKIDIAQKQLSDKNGYIHRNYQAFCKEMHKIRRKVENGKRVYNSLLGPEGQLYVDPEKDITVRYVIIGGRTVDDLEESGKRYDFHNMTNPNIHLETWDSWLKKLSRK